MKSIQLFLTGFGGLIATASAQTTPTQPVSLDEMVVQAEREKALTVPNIEDSREELAKTPGGTEVIDSERFLTGRSSTMADTFALSPGVVAQPRFGSDEARLSIRGSGLQRTFHGRGIRLLQDGVPINMADGGFDMQAVDPLATDHINVLRGGNALTLGSSTLGGAIDYVSATGLNAPGYSMRLEGGSFDYFRARLAAGVSQGNVDAYISLSEQYLSGFREHAEQNNQRLLSNFGWKIADNIETRLFLTAINAESELPGNLTKAQLEDDPEQANPGTASSPGNIASDQKRDFEFYRAASKTTVTNGDNTVDFIAAYTYKDLFHPIYQVIDVLSQDMLVGTTFTNTTQIFGRDNRFRMGAFLTHGRSHSVNFLNVSGQPGTRVAEATQTATNYEAFIENQHALGYDFTGVIGATASSSRRENSQSLGTSPSYTRTYDDFSPKVGLRWDRENYQIFGNVSSSYEPPSFSETNGAIGGLPTPNKAQTANTLEIGTRGSHAAFRWDATVYHSQIKNEFLSLNNSAGVSLGTTNADETIHQGIELFGEVDLLGSAWTETPEHRLVARSAWTYGRFKFDDDDTYGDNTLAGLPPHLIRGELVWETQAGYYAGPTFEWVPVKSYIDQANTFSADPYALLGFKFGKRTEKGLSWFVEAKNLLDETYAATTGVIANASGADSSQFLPGDGRSIFAGLEWKW